MEVWKFMKMRNLELKRQEPNRDKGMVLKATEVMVLILMSRILSSWPKFKRFTRKLKANFKKESSSKVKVLEKCRL